MGVIPFTRRLSKSGKASTKRVLAVLFVAMLLTPALAMILTMRGELVAADPDLTTYDFNDANNHLAWEEAVASAGTLTNVPGVPSLSAATSGDNDSIENTDDTRWETSLADGQADEWNVQYFKLAIAEGVDTIDNIEFLWEGFGKEKADSYAKLYVWDNGGGSWSWVLYNEGTSHANDENLENTITSDIANFIYDNSGEGQFWLAVKAQTQDGPGQKLATDYVRVIVNYTVPAAWNLIETWTGTVDAYAILPTQPTLISPDNDNTVYDNTPIFDWAEGDNADNHRLLIDNNSDFSSPKENRVLMVSTYTIENENYLPDNIYWWKVIAQNENGGTESDVRTFEVKTSGPFNFGWEENGENSQNISYAIGEIPASAHSLCGEESGYENIYAIDNDIETFWIHAPEVAENHWIIFDIGESRTVTQIQIYNTRLINFGHYDVAVYISENTVDWGDAVWEGQLKRTPAGWKSTGNFSKLGQFIRLVSRNDSDDVEGINEIKFYVDWPPSRRILGTKFLMNMHIGGTADNITAYFQTGDNYPENMRAAIYSTGGTLIGQTDQLTFDNSVDENWRTFSFPSDNRPALSANTNYVLVLWGNGDIYFAYEENADANGYYVDENYASQFPGSVTFVSDGTKQYSIYCSVSYSGGPPSDPWYFNPTGGETVTDNTPTLSLLFEGRENTSHYRFIVDNNSDFSSPEIYSGLIEPPEPPGQDVWIDYTVPDENALESGRTYYWKVYPWNPLYERTNVSSEWFKVAGYAYVTTSDATSIASTQATLNADITYLGVDNVNAYFEYKSRAENWVLENYVLPTDPATAGNWGNRTPVRYIAASNSSQEDNDFVAAQVENGYQCDGTKDETEIQKFIDNLWENYDGGKVFLFDGTYNININIEMRTGVSLVGESRDNTILRQIGDVGYFIHGYGASDVLIENVHIWGKDSTNPSETMGIDFGIWKSQNVVVKNVLAHGFSYSAFAVEAWGVNIPSNNIWFINVEAYDTAGPGIMILNTENFYIDNCYLHDVGHGLGYFNEFAGGIAVWDSKKGMIVNNTIENSGGDGIWIQRMNFSQLGSYGNVEDILIQSNLIENVGTYEPWSKGIWLRGAASYEIDNVIMRNNRFVENRENYYWYGVYFVNSYVENCVVDNNDFFYVENAWVERGTGHVIENNVGATFDNTILENTALESYSKVLTGLDVEGTYAYRGRIWFDGSSDDGFFVYFSTTARQWNLIENWTGSIEAPTAIPVVENLYITDMDNVATDNLAPETQYKFWVEIEDNESLADIENVTLVVYLDNENLADNAATHYTFRWTSDGGFEEIGPDSGVESVGLVLENYFENSALLEGPRQSVSWSTLSPNLVVVADFSTQISVISYDEATTEFTVENSLNTSTAFESVSWSPHGGLIAAVGLDSGPDSLVIYSYDNVAKTLTKENSFSDNAYFYWPISVAWSPFDPSLIAATGYDNDTISIFSYDNVTKALVRENYLETENLIMPRGVDWSPFYPELFAVASIGAHRINVYSYNSTTKELVEKQSIYDLPETRHPYSVSWSPHDPKLIASTVDIASNDGITILSYDNSLNTLTVENSIDDPTAVDRAYDVSWSPHNTDLIAVVGELSDTVVIFSYDNVTKALVSENYITNPTALEGPRGVDWNPNTPELIAAVGIDSDTLAVVSVSLENLYEHLVVENSVAGDNTKTVDNFIFVIKFSENATVTDADNWDVYIEVWDSAGNQDNRFFLNQFDIISAAEWNLIETWTGTVEAPAEWQEIENWTGTVEAPSEWSLIETWSGTIEAPSEWQLVETWSGAVEAVTQWELIETWSGTIQSPSAWDLVETWNGTVEAPAQWSLIEEWSGTLQAPTAWNLIESWDGTVQAPAAWELIETWDGTVEAPTEWNLIETWTGTVIAPIEWNLIEQWSGTVEAFSGWQLLETWTGTVEAFAEWRLIETWTGTVQTPSVPVWNLMETWTGTIEAPAAWVLIETWTGSIQAPTAWNLIETWEGTITAPSAWSLIESWAGTVEAYSGWVLIETWTGTIETPAQWSLVETWSGAIEVPAGWWLMETWTGTVEAFAQWQIVETWSGSIEAPAAWQLLETWTGSIEAPTAWQLIETWTGTIEASTAWQLIETWSGSIQAPTAWLLLETWSGSVQAPAEWSEVENWTGDIIAVGWTLIETWDGTVHAPGWLLTETWTGSIRTPAVYAVSISITPSENSGTLGDTLTYTVIVVNIGGTIDNYDLASSDAQGWAAYLDDNVILNMAPSASENTTLNVGLSTLGTHTITVTATSQGDSSVSDLASCMAISVSEAPPGTLVGGSDASLALAVAMLALGLVFCLPFVLMIRGRRERQEGEVVT